MERDSLIAHGVAGALRDRLMLCSDCSDGYVCRKCGSLIGCWPMIKIEGMCEVGIKEQVSCHQCNSKECEKVAIPYVLRYLVNELAAMNVKVSFGLSGE